MQALWVQSLPKLVQEVSLPAIQAQVTVERALLDTETVSQVCLYIKTHMALVPVKTRDWRATKDVSLVTTSFWLIPSFPGYSDHSLCHSHPSL